MDTDPERLQQTSKLAKSAEITPTLTPDLNEKARALGIEIVPVPNSADESVPMSEFVMDENVASEQLHTIMRAGHQILQATGAFTLLPLPEQRAFLKLARCEEESPRDYVGAKINEMRLRTGMTKESVAAFVGKSLSATNRFLDGTAYPRLDDVANVLREVNRRNWQNIAQNVDREEVVSLLVQYQRERFARYHQGREPNAEESKKFFKNAKNLYEQRIYM
jgi:hypothetical protein